MKRHRSILIVLVLVVFAAKRQLSSGTARSEGEQLAAQLASLSASGKATEVAAVTEPATEAELIALRTHAFRVHQLRGEMTLARQRFENLVSLVTNLTAKVHARTNQTESVRIPEFPAGYLPHHELADRGNSTPEAALETFWWAMSRGNLPKLFAVSAEMAGQPVPENPNRDDDFTQVFRSFPGYQVVKRENGAPGQLVMGFRTAPDARVVDMILVHTNGQWLVSVDSMQKSFEDSSR